MLLKAMSDLLGGEVIAKDGRCGALEDLYFDRDCWRLCYLLIGSGASHTLVSIGGVEAATPAREPLTLALSHAQLRAQAGAWPAQAAAQWLDELRVCSARQTVGWSVAAEDGPAGEVADLLLDPDTWSIDYVVARMSGDGSRKHLALPLDWAEPLDPRERMLRMRCTRTQLASAPEIA